MKTSIRRRNRQKGLVLVVILTTSVIIAFMLTSYLLLVNNQNMSVTRSAAWNEAIPVLESGLEEGLTQLEYAGTNAVMLTSNGWTYGLDGKYHKSRTITNAGYFDVSIQPAFNPVIVSTGYVALPFRSSGTNTSYISRRVRIVAGKQNIAPGGLSARGIIKFSGGGSLDSFDSSDPAYSTGGAYDPAKRKDNGRVVSNLGSAGAIQVGTGLIYGSATTGPGGTVTTSGGDVGDAAWIATHTGIQPGHTNNDANVQFDDVPAPFVYGTGTTPISGTYPYLGTNYTYQLMSGNYNAASFTVPGGGILLVTGDAVLYVSGKFTVSGSGFVYIAPGASLKVYANDDITISGGGVVNGTQLASQCSFFGMPGCSKVTYSGSAAYIGTVNAPSALFTFSGGAGASGSFAASTMTISGGAAIHYDESLGGPGAYAVVSWNEF